MSSNNSETRPLLHRNTTRNSASRASLLLTPSPTTSRTNLFSRTRSDRNHCRTRAASATILLSLVFERIAFYGLTGNLVLFLNKDPFRWESYHAIDASLYFFGFCFVMSLIGGWLADAFLGRFKAIFISYIIYLIGYVFMPLMTIPTNQGNITQSNLPNINMSLPAICKVSSKDDSADSNNTDHNDIDPFDEQCAWLIYITLTIIAIGTGFVKANIAPFGSDQVAREGQQTTLSFFNWFYWSINLGAFVGLSVITYVQQQKSFFHGYLASVSCLAASALLFVAGRCFYFVRAPDGSVLTNIFRIIREAFRKKKQRKQQIAIQSARNSRGREVDEADPIETDISFLDYAKHRHGGIFHDALVDDVKQLKKIFAVFAVLIPYWLVYFQMQTTFLIQGLHMRLLWGYNGSATRNMNSLNQSDILEVPQLVAAWFSLFDVAMLILLLPLFDRIIYPWIERRTGSPVDISWRIFLGMIFAAAAMVTAGVVENFRLEIFWPNSSNTCYNASINQLIGNTEYQAADMSIIWQIPQYALLGLSEVFASVAGLQFAVSVAPRSMKGIIMGLFYLFSGIGSFLGTAVIMSLNSARIWFLSPDYGNINCRSKCDTPKCDNTKCDQQCHLDYYFYLLAAIEMFGSILFLLVAKFFHLDEHHRHSRSRQLADTSGDLLDNTQSQQHSGSSQPHSINRNNCEAASTFS